MSERSMAEAFESLPVAAFVVDERRRIEAINREARRLIGRRGKAPRGTTCRQLFGCRIAEKRCPLRRALVQRAPVRRAVVPVSLKSGERSMIERAAWFRGADGRPRAAVVCGPATAYLKRLGELRTLARFDRLTGVLSREYFERCFRARRPQNKRLQAFLMIDIDGLKAVNDRWGHEAGDLVLARLGRLLGQQTRRGELVGRVGGDEFAVLCRGTTRKAVASLLARLRRAIRADNAARAGEPVLSVGIGTAFSRLGGRSLRQSADRRLYQYKRRRARRAVLKPRRAQAPAP